MIELNNVSFQYAGNTQECLRNIDLHIQGGECVLLCGGSGCGKTTILRLINGLIPDYFDGELSGNVLYNGSDISDMEMYERSRFVGSVFQNPRIQFFNVDTDSEIAFGMENLAMDPDIMKNRMDDTTRRLRLAPLRGRSIFELSGGEKQRIAFASVYAMNPDVFLLDEPSSNLDLESIDELRFQIRTIKEQGKTILISEHRIYYLMDLVDRIVFIEDGCIREVFTPEELTEEKRLALGLRCTTKKSVQIPAPRRQPKTARPDMTSSDTASHDATSHDTANSATAKFTLRIENLSLMRGKRTLQSGLTMKAHTDDIIGIIGPNGSGKTTLLRTLCGLHKEYSGRISLNGKELKKKELNKLSYLVMQDVNYELFADSVANECQLGLPDVSEELVADTLTELGLYTYKDRHPATLSGGQKQKVAVAVSMTCHKKLLMFDEPTSGLDYQSMLQVTELIQHVAKHAIVFIVSHDSEFLNLVCTKVYKLNKENDNEEQQ